MRSTLATIKGASRMRIKGLSRLEHESLQGNSGKFLARTLVAFFEKRRRQGGSVRRLHLA
jgi:hypothetical protein